MGQFRNVRREQCNATLQGARHHALFLYFIQAICAWQTPCWLWASAGKIMKVTLRNRKTGEYFNSAGGWVASGLQAHNFGYSDAAEEACEKLGLPDIHVFYIFNSPDFNYGASADCGLAA